MYKLQVAAMSPIILLFLSLAFLLLLNIYLKSKKTLPLQYF